MYTLRLTSYLAGDDILWPHPDDDGVLCNACSMSRPLLQEWGMEVIGRLQSCTGLDWTGLDWTEKNPQKSNLMLFCARQRLEMCAMSFE
jgi:hypothetical protein